MPPDNRYSTSINPVATNTEDRSYRDLFGSTPIVQILSIPDAVGPAYAKLEKYNPGGSIKDRVALYILDKIEAEGLLSKNRTVVESSSGNLGIALAMLGAQRNIRTIIVVDPNTSTQNISIMKAYGAEIIIEEELDEKGLYHFTKVRKAQIIASKTGGYWINQTANALNAEAHQATTGQEILNQCGDIIDFCLVATSSGGQITGIARAIKASRPNIKIVAVDARGSQIFSSQQKSYLTPGLGLSWRPSILDEHLIDLVCLVNDSAAFETARYLAHSGLLVGPSSGAVAAALFRIQHQHPNSAVLGIFSDGGERYLNTLFNDDWMSSKGFKSNPSGRYISNISRDIYTMECHAK